MFSLICVWINGWVNNREAGDLRRHSGHYDVNVMFGTGAIWKANRGTLTKHEYMRTSSNGNNVRVTGHLCVEFTGPGEFPRQRPVTRSFDIYFDLRPNIRLSKQSWGWWFETPSRTLWTIALVELMFLLIKPTLNTVYFTLLHLMTTSQEVISISWLPEAAGQTFQNDVPWY